MGNLVERLRNWPYIYPDDLYEPEGYLYEVAADRIEELEAESDALKVELIRVRARVYYLCREMKEALISQTPAKEGEER